MASVTSLLGKDAGVFCFDGGFSRRAGRRGFLHAGPTFNCQPRSDSRQPLLLSQKDSMQGFDCVLPMQGFSSYPSSDLVFTRALPFVALFTLLYLSYSTPFVVGVSLGEPTRRSLPSYSVITHSFPFTCDQPLLYRARRLRSLYFRQPYRAC